MVKSSSGIKFVLVLVMVMVSTVTMAPTFAPRMEIQDNDSFKRNARSTNLSHITGTDRKLELFINNQFLQIFNNGTVEGTMNDNDYSILKMRAVNTGQMIIQGIASCSFLCMNSCGCLFAANECTEECKFNEIIEPNNFNSYSSVKYSNALDIWYVALKNNSKPRRTRRKPGTGLGSLSEYILALPYPVSKDRLEALEKQEQNIDSNFKHHRRHGQICPPISCTNSSPAFFTKSPENCECKKKRKKHQNVNGSGSKLPSLSSKKKSSGDADFHSKKKSGHKNLGIKKQQSSSSSSEKLIKAAERVENADEREATTLALDDE